MRSFFFFSSRRRHTRSYGDWSSDVCSSDLDRAVTRRIALSAVRLTTVLTTVADVQLSLFAAPAPVAVVQRAAEIGRASCRERAAVSDGDVSVPRRGATLTSALIRARHLSVG